MTCLKMTRKMSLSRNFKSMSRQFQWLKIIISSSLQRIGILEFHYTCLKMTNFFSTLTSQKTYLSLLPGPGLCNWLKFFLQNFKKHFWIFLRHLRISRVDAFFNETVVIGAAIANKLSAFFNLIVFEVN